MRFSSKSVRTNTRAMGDRLAVVCAVLATGVMGCLHSFHDYSWKSDSQTVPGLRIRFEPTRLYRAGGDYVDGRIVDSSLTYYRPVWFMASTDSIRPMDHIRCDSLWLISAKSSDTIRCLEQVLVSSRSKWFGAWPCGGLSLARTGGEIEFHMMVTLVFADSSESRGYEYVSTGKLKTTRVHTDY